MKIDEVSVLEHFAFLAGKFRTHSAQAIINNAELHSYVGPAIDQNITDATLTMFLNFVAASWGSEMLFVAADLAQLGALPREDAPKIRLLVAEDEVAEEEEESQIITADNPNPNAKKAKQDPENKIIIP